MDSLASLNLSELRPKDHLILRMMFDGRYALLSATGLLLAVVTLLLAVAGVRSVLLEKRLQSEGLIAQATIDGKETHQPGKTVYFDITYTFVTADGCTIHGRDDLPKATWEPLEPGDTIEVQYLPSDPERNRLASDDPQGLGRAMWAAVLVPVPFLLASLALLGRMYRRTSRHADLLRRGVLVGGIVDEKTEREEMRIKRGCPCNVRFHFQLPGGQIRHAEELVTEIEFVQKLQPDGPVGVIYDPRNPERCAVFREGWLKFFRRGPEKA